MLTVENTGDVLAPELVATLVEPFQRGTERVRTDHAGVGLGLAIVQRIAQAHDGTLTLAPRRAAGSASRSSCRSRPWNRPNAERRRTRRRRTDRARRPAVAWRRPAPGTSTG